MGLLKGNLSFRRYRVVGELPSGFRDRYIEAVQKNAFRENLEARTTDDNIGWVNLTDPDNTAFDLNALFYNQYLVASLRMDRKRVPAKLLAILHQRRCREVMEAKGVERLSASHKRDLKEALEEELLRRALPTVAVHDMAWDLDGREVRFFCTSSGVNDLFQAYFKDTFGLDLVRLSMTHWLEQAGLTMEEIEAGIAEAAPELGF